MLAHSAPSVSKRGPTHSKQGKHQSEKNKNRSLYFTSLQRAMATTQDQIHITLHFLHVYTAMLYLSSTINLSRRRADDSTSAISSRDAAIPDPKRLWSNWARTSQVSAWEWASESSSVDWLPKLELPASEDVSSRSLLFSELLDNSVPPTSFLNKDLA